MTGLARDLSDLPAGEPDEGEPPDKVMDIMGPIAQVFAELFVEDEDRPFSIEGTRVRGSWATKCARAISYGMVGAPKAERSVESAWAMYLGRMVHAAVDEALVKAFPDAEVEVTVDLRPDIDGCGNIDAVIVEHRDQERVSSDGVAIAADVPFTTVFELKTINGYGYKLGTTSFKGPAQGPKWSHKVQGALYASGMKADRLVVGWVGMEAMAPGFVPAGYDPLLRVMAQWSYTPEEFEPIAERERKRLTKIIAMVDTATTEPPEGQAYDPQWLPPRIPDDPEIPVRARIVEPMVPGKPDKGRWELHDDQGRVLQAGLTWHCGYCDYRETCIADGPS